jgi:hypothetical protein
VYEPGFATRHTLDGLAVQHQGRGDGFEHPFSGIDAHQTLRRDTRQAHRAVEDHRGDGLVATSLVVHISYRTVTPPSTPLGKDPVPISGKS